MKVKNFISKFEELFPTNLAYEWDNVGLQVGNGNSEITNILISLDLTDKVIDEAVHRNANLIILHHPIIFKAMKSISTDTLAGTLLIKAIRHNINIYVAHTNFDISNYGMNQILADLLQLKNQKILQFVTETEGLGKSGELQEPMLFEKLVQTLKTTFGLETIKLIGTVNHSDIIRSVAIVGGSGSSLLSNPKLKDIDVFITGDITYHYALDALSNGITILDVGHNIEKVALPKLQEIITEFSKEFHVFVSEMNTDPYKLV